MSGLTLEELRKRSYERAAWVLWHYWEEQKENPKREASVHTRLFDTLVPNIEVVGISEKGGGHKEHLVPCKMLRDRAFQMYWDEKSKEEVAEMLGKFLRIAHIARDEAHHLDHKLGLKTKMPDDWDFETGSVMARLVAAGIKLRQG